MTAFLAVGFAGADPAARLAGHWEGAIHAPFGDVAVHVDLAIDDSGKLAGTFSNPGQRLNGFPLWSANVVGETVKLELKTDPNVQTFNGRMSADGETIEGQFLIGVQAVPFTLKRNGEARFAPPPRSPALDAKLTGQWTGSLDLGGMVLPLELTLTNHADRTATGAWSSGGSAVPVAIAVDGATVTVSSPVTPATFTGTLSDDGMQIVGSLSDSSVSRPVVFTRVAGGR